MFHFVLRKKIINTMLTYSSLFYHQIIKIIRQRCFYSPFYEYPCKKNQVTTFSIIKNSMRIILL